MDPTIGDLAYHYDGITSISSDAVVEEQCTESGTLFYWNTSSEENGVLEVTENAVENNLPSNKLLESLQVVNNVEVTDEKNYMPVGFLKNLSTEDEYYEVIKPTLISRNYDEEESNISSCFEEETPTGTGVQYDNSEDSNTRFDLLNIENNTGVNMEENFQLFTYLSKGCENTCAPSSDISAQMKTSTLFLCPVEGCNKKFTSNFAVNIHMKIHTGERLYMCNDCAKSFKSSSHLAKHAKSHTGIKPFFCPIKSCNRPFSTSNILKVHVRSHTGERPYACQHPGCGKAFISQANLNNHQRIHSGEKPFECKIMGCKKRFTEYSTLYKHMYSPRHHKNVKLPDDLLVHISQNSEINFDEI